MSDEFETVTEDGSAGAVAEDIVCIWDETPIEKGDLNVDLENLQGKLA